MQLDFTDITIVVDRSGSMECCRSDAEGGINSFVREQADAPGKAVLTLVQFDTEYEFVHRAVPIQNVPSYKLVPRGGTALLDAVGRAINEAGHRLSQIPEIDRPGLVSVVIVTDGQENSSKEFTLEKVREMISHQRQQYNWRFTFLGADDSAFDQADGMGISVGDVAQYSTDKAGKAYAAVSKKMLRTRSSVASGDILAAPEFTLEERDSMI